MKKIDWEEAAECLRLISHSSRLKLIYLLLQKSYSVGELAEVCDLLPNVASEHLNLMRNKGLIIASKKDRKVYYTIADDALSAILGCIQKRFSS